MPDWTLLTEWNFTRRESLGEHLPFKPQSILQTDLYHNNNNNNIFINYARHKQQKLISREGVGKQTLEKIEAIWYSLSECKMLQNFTEYFTQHS